MQLRGRIVEEQKNFYLVDTEKGIVRSTLKGVLKKQRKRLYVGDLVTIEVFNRDTPEGIIRELFPRKNQLPKPAVANVDQVVCIITLKEPALDVEFLDRLLFTTGVLAFSASIVFNKSDLLTPADSSSLLKIIAYYKKIGYMCIQTSALSGENIGRVIELCRDSQSIFAGPSGTGKSTLLAKIFPDHTFRVAALSKNIERGVHTTTHTTLLKLTDSGYIADTPGFSYVELPIVSEEEVGSFFPEIDEGRSACKFSNCIHQNEPACAVKQMVDTGDILRSRYEQYLKIYNFMLKKRRTYSDSRNDR